MPFFPSYLLSSLPFNEEDIILPTLFAWKQEKSLGSKKVKPENSFTFPISYSNQSYIPLKKKGRKF